jgi:hypothetical protein
MGHSESHLVHELRKVIAQLREKCDVQERQIEELRDAVAALMEQDMPRILCTQRIPPRHFPRETPISGPAQRA